MTYATAAELADALRIAVTPANQALLDACVAAAAEEIDGFLDAAVPAPVPASINRVNVNRAVEWYKAADATYGVVGQESTGTLPAPTAGFRRYALAIAQFKGQWGVA
jgi:hypothetical protein